MYAYKILILIYAILEHLCYLGIFINIIIIIISYMHYSMNVLKKRR